MGSFIPHLVCPKEANIEETFACRLRLPAGSQGSGQILRQGFPNQTFHWPGMSISSNKGAAANHNLSKYFK